MPGVGTTAVVVLIPEADALLRDAAAVSGELIRPGVPAHVTLLYPFVELADITSACRDQVQRSLAGRGPVDVVLDRVVREPGFVAVSVSGIDGLITAVRHDWPQLIPYRGRFGAAPPAHLSVAMGGSENEADAVVSRVTARLPVVSRINEAHVVGLTDSGWKPLVTADLA